ncbi:MAG: hypothetical protein A3H27_18055 [Acidobacteria bacterium RIFCSPLOWO2_02_FULL_59_13]|nr:MAG: hypothetical protein A3H27_18055 [Acidobacteria bacterium RIFCSPLOWO2_02_FULL_59_13]
MGVSEKIREQEKKIRALPLPRKESQMLARREQPARNMAPSAEREVGTASGVVRKGRHRVGRQKPQAPVFALALPSKVF